MHQVLKNRGSVFADKMAEHSREVENSISWDFLRCVCQERKMLAKLTEVCEMKHKARTEHCKPCQKNHDAGGIESEIHGRVGTMKLIVVLPPVNKKGLSGMM